jgi:hypothetical protein
MFDTTYVAFRRARELVMLRTRTREATDDYSTGLFDLSRQTVPTIRSEPLDPKQNISIAASSHILSQTPVLASEAAQSPKPHHPTSKKKSSLTVSNGSTNIRA